MTDTPANLVEWFNTEIQNHAATFIIYYRGEFLKQFIEVHGELQGKNVGVFAISAHSKEKVDEMVAKVSLPFKSFSDPEHTLRDHLKEQGYVDIIISGGPGTEKEDLYHEIRKYKLGVAQPAVLCIKPDKSVLYSWHIVPNPENLGGAKDRPLPKDIWAEVQKKL